MKVTFELSQTEAISLAAELHRAARRRRKEALYRLSQDYQRASQELADLAKLFQRLSAEVLEKAL